ncbi:MAG: outer membrane protein assembly factor, partial [Bacteroidota bacterium]
MGLFWREWRMGAKIRLLLLLLLVTACNTLKKVGDDELLLTKNTIYADGEKVSGEDLRGLLAQKPNSHVLGYPLRLNLYNMAKEDSDSLFLDWLHRKEKREERLNRMLSKKQVNRLRESFVVKGANDFLKRIGEPPSIIDTTLAQKSIDRLKAYYNTKGYFNSKGQYVIVPTKRKKRAELNYNLDLGQPYSIDSVATNITSYQLDSMYQKYRTETFVKQGDIFDLENFNSERERLTSLFRNNGVYNFQESSINYTIEQDTVRTSDDKGMNVQLNIEKPVTTTETDTLTNEYYVHRFKKINIYSDYDISGTNHSLESIEFDNYIIYYYDELKYRPKALADAVFFEKDSV